MDFEQGQWTSATRWAAEVIEAPRTTPYALVTALGALGRVRVRRGDPGAREVLERAIELGSAGELQHRWSPVCGLAEHHIVAGRIDDAVALLEPHYAEALETDSPWARGELGYWMHRAGCIDTAPSRSAAPFAAMIDGDWRTAARLWEGLGCPFEIATALSLGDESAHRQAIDMLDALGARPAADAARKRLRARGASNVPGRPRSSSMDNPAGLTGRQLEVTECIVAGLDNGEISERLFISRKTVEHHVTAIFLKLGVDTRPKAIAAALRLGIGTNGGGLSET
jgi:DNA-binding CsgD family transcriptional regulator